MDHTRESRGAPRGGRPGSSSPATESDDSGRPGALAAWGPRVCAKLVDTLVVAVPSFLCYFLGELFLDAGAWISTVVSMIGWLWVIYEMGTTGQSVGKRRMDIRLVGELTGRPVGFGRAVVYEVAQILDALPLGVGYLWPLIDKKRQTFSDKMLHTLAVRA
ncbi:RDD family protein [Streptomyces sp. NPDC050704]|uniref:RDD family protein n=1 Tax=Streptomyces sp. NPDC050704 TaxID=3157219 RepID=UPI00341F0B14